MVTSLYFHATGHEPTIPSIKFDAAFVGMHGEVDSFVVAGLLVAMNTLVSQIFFAVSLPLLVYWIILSSAKTRQMECVRKMLFEIILQLTFCYSLKAITLVLAASIHRRHLMIWNVFAPRFLYEGAFFAISEVILFSVYIVVA
jgi:phosphatidylinositol glycan class O